MIFDYLKKTMPTISDTERVAIEAGDTWLEKDILQGNINWDDWLLKPASTFTVEEQAFIDGPVQTLCEMANDYEINEHGDLPIAIWDFIKEHKFLSMIIPKEHGGLDFSPSANSHIVSLLGSVSPALAVTVMVPNSLGPGELLHKYGTEEQQDKWLPGLANGSEIPCFGLTSLHAGSDAGSITDLGEVIEEDGKLKLRLNFRKRYITLAPVATVIGVAFKVSDPLNLLGDDVNLGITCALIPAETDGVDTSRRHKPMGMAFMNGPVIGEDVVVDLDEAVIGGREMVGQGWRMLVECLSAGRGVSLPAMAAASSQTTLKHAVLYTQLRKQFNTKIASFEGIQEPLARMGINACMIESMRKVTLQGLDAGITPSVVTAMTKLHTTELARENVNYAFDIHGGKAIMQGPLNSLYKFYQGSPVAITVEGANIMTRNLMVFGQGSIRCHPYLLDEMAAIENDDKEAFNELLKEHLKYVAKNAFTSFGHGLTFNIFNRGPDSNYGKIGDLCSEIDRMSLALSVATDYSLLILGGDLKKREYVSSRLGDVLSYLFIAASCARCIRAETAIITRAAIKDALFKAGQAFEEFFASFPNRYIAFKIRATSFPTGIQCPRLTIDELQKVAKTLAKDYVIKELTPLVYDDQNLRCLEKGLKGHGIYSQTSISVNEFEEPTSVSIKPQILNKVVDNKV